jgi:hypothetical protein
VKDLDLLRAQVYAIRVTADAILFALDGQPGAAPATVPGACPQCGAPEEKQVDASTMTNPGVKKCLLCQAEYPG